MVRSITSQSVSFSRLRACEGEISWSTRITSASCARLLSSSRLPVPKYAVWSNWARFCVNVPTTAMPSVLASWRSSVSEASNSASLTLDRCTAATMARLGFSRVSWDMGRGDYQIARPVLELADPFDLRYPPADQRDGGGERVARHRHVRIRLHGEALARGGAEVSVDLHGCRRGDRDALVGLQIRLARDAEQLPFRHAPLDAEVLAEFQPAVLPRRGGSALRIHALELGLALALALFHELALAADGVVLGTLRGGRALLRVGIDHRRLHTLRRRGVGEIHASIGIRPTVNLGRCAEGNEQQENESEAAHLSHTSPNAARSFPVSRAPAKASP